MLNQIDLARADLNLLVLYEAVLGEGHVGRAAERLHLTPSAVSHGLGRLRRLLNDPLFLKTPRGVVPTERALALRAPIAEVLAQVRSVLSSAAPFEPATSRRRFTLGAPDGVSAVFLPALVADLQACAPGIDIALQQLLPVPGEPAADRAWRNAFADLDARTLDLAIIPHDQAPTRFARRPLYDEGFVIVMRSGHPFARRPTLARYCEAQHLVVSATGDPQGFVDDLLARQGLARRVALTAPNFIFALAVLADTDLLCAVPRRFAALHAARFGLETLESPLPMPAFALHLVAPQVALMDAGLAWLAERVVAAMPASRARPAAGRVRRRASARG